jgi:hypothetical protein
MIYGINPARQERDLISGHMRDSRGSVGQNRAWGMEHGARGICQWVERESK